MITQAQIDSVAERLQGQSIDERVINTLRSEFSDIHFTYCMDDDVIAASPVLQAELFNLYLIDSRNHCLCFTQDETVASGIVVAEIEAE
jgi:hypothetical protein